MKTTHDDFAKLFCKIIVVKYRLIQDFIDKLQKEKKHKKEKFKKEITQKVKQNKKKKKCKVHNSLN